MKKFLVILLPFALGVTVPAIADTKALANRVNEYIGMEQKHSSSWFDYTKNFQSAKMDLKKKHLNEKMEVVKNNIAKLGKGVAPEQYLQEQLDEMIALHKKQQQDWKTFHEQQDEKVQNLMEKDEAELASFEEKYQE